MSCLYFWTRPFQLNAFIPYNLAYRRFICGIIFILLFIKFIRLVKFWSYDFGLVFDRHYHPMDIR